jgi:hypothetical protein
LKITVLNSILVSKIENEGLVRAVIDLTKKLNEELETAWTESSEKAIDKAIKEFGKAEDPESGLKKLLPILALSLTGILSGKQERRIKVLVNGFYHAVKKSYAKKVKVGHKISKLDKSIVPTISKEPPYWIGNFYDRQLSNRIGEIGRYIVGRDLTLKESSVAIRKALERELSLFTGPVDFKSTIPARYAGNVGRYTKLLSQTVSTRSTNFGRLSAMADKGIERFVFVAVMDDRTTEICQFMNGREFTVSNGISVMNKMIGANSPEEFKEISPWVTAEEAVEIAGDGDLISQSQNLSDNGVMIPPLHGG